MTKKKLPQDNSAATPGITLALGFTCPNFKTHILPRRIAKVPALPGQHRTTTKPHLPQLQESPPHRQGDPGPQGLRVEEGRLQAPTCPCLGITLVQTRAPSPSSPLAHCQHQP